MKMSEGSPLDPGPNRTADLPLRRRPLYPLSYWTLWQGYHSSGVLSTLRQDYALSRHLQ